MTDTSLDDLARRLVAHPRWVWAVGTALAGGDQIRPDTLAVTHRSLPDLTSDATGGVLLGMVVLAGRDVGLEWLRTTQGDMLAVDWYVGDVMKVARGSTLAEACARALLKLWGEP